MAAPLRKKKSFSYFELLTNTTVNGDCRIWKGNPDKYGNVWHEGISWRAHVLAYFLNTGQRFPVIRHTCDTPGCIVFEHLKGGTQSENMMDKMIRGRHKPHKHSKLNKEKAEKIRTMNSDGIGYRKLAKMFGVAVGSIVQVVKRNSYAYGLVLAFLIFPPSISTQTTVDINGFYETTSEFAKKYNGCVVKLQEKESNNISPYSPDYWDEFLSCWVRSGVSDDFGKLERRINDISWILGRKGK